MTMRRVAVFIDAENVAVSVAQAILDEAARYGAVRDRRLYGDFVRRAHLAAWLEIAPDHALTPRQTAGGTTGKNSADIALVIDAVEMLCRDEADVFCIATRDGDFTQLAMRIRQSGKTAVGIAQAMPSHHFRRACDAFVNVGKAREEPASSPSIAAAGKTSPACKTPVPRKLEASLLQRVFVAVPRLDGGWVGLPEVMKALRACKPDFEVKAYGHGQFSKLLAFSGVELASGNRKARLNVPGLKKVVDNG